jgi:hypothetical protein
MARFGILYRLALCYLSYNLRVVDVALI